MDLILVVYSVAFLINIPFGFFREKYPKLSFKWFLMIHAPVPIVILLRFFTGIELTFTTFVISLFSAVAGQFFGSRVVSHYVTKRINSRN